MPGKMPPAPGRIQNPGAVIKRLLSYMKEYRLRFTLVIICILISAGASALSAMFIQVLIDNYLTPLMTQKNPDLTNLHIMILCMGGVFAVGALAGLAYNRLMVTISQGIQKKIRDEMFAHMQTLPISYFDRNQTGDSPQQMADAVCSAVCGTVYVRYKEDSLRQRCEFRCTAKAARRC